MSGTGGVQARNGDAQGIQVQSRIEMSDQGGAQVRNGDAQDRGSLDDQKEAQLQRQLIHIGRKLQDMKRSWKEGENPDDLLLRGILAELKNLNEIGKLNLIGKSLGDSIIGLIGKAMEEVPFPNLRILELGGNNISDKGIEAIARALKAGHLPVLESLGLFRPRAPQERRRFVMQEESQWNRNVIGDAGVSLLASAFLSGNCSALKILTLEQNMVGNDGAKALADAIHEGCLPSLQILNLSYNILGHGGTIALAKAFATSGAKLKVLDLESCRIRSSGTTALANAFMSSNLQELTELYLAKNNTNWNSTEDAAFDSGLIQLARVLQDGYLRKLQVLDLEGNAGGPKSAEAFTNAFRDNKSLVLELRGPYARKAKSFMLRNKKTARILQSLQGEEDVQATNGKIFLCGHPRQGKTTLRKTLQRDYPPLINKFVREKGPHEEPRTRGIEVSHVDAKGEKGGVPVSIAVWDLAGQPEYQILHSAFLPDLAIADGQATTFVIVCDAEYYRSDHGRELEARGMLKYWMRFIASSSLKGVDEGKRHVLIVLNRFKSKPCEYVDHWEHDLKKLREDFRDYLEIHASPFVVDARTADSVKVLKEHLICHTRSRLAGKSVPNICRHMQDAISEYIKTTNFPLISWSRFTSNVFKSSASDEKLKAAANYLHESGHLILFREGPEGSIGEGVGPGRSLVILDPDWFCKRVVGQLLLPEVMLDRDEAPLNRKLHPDGSLALRELKMHFDHLFRDEEQVSDILAMLLRLGICYKVSDKKVLIPALIKGDTYPTGCWDMPGVAAVRDQWVMGYCLEVRYMATTLLPIAVFRRLQVQLAGDPTCAAEDMEYTVGKFFITFKTKGMAVLVEFANEQDHPQDRVDFLVRPLVNRESDRRFTPEQRRGEQMKVAQGILDRFVSLAEIWSPGVDFVRKLVRPWSTAEGTLPMPRRHETLSVEKVKVRVLEDGPEAMTSWTVLGEFVMAADLLTGVELRECQNSIQEKIEFGEQLIVDLGFLPAQHDDSGGDNSGEVTDSSPSQRGEQTDGAVMGPWDSLWRHIDGKFDETNSHIDARMDKMEGSFLRNQRKVFEKLQALERFSRDEIKSSVPRFIYLTKSKDSSGMWVTLREAFVENVTLHFLCEARYDDQSFHEVQDQNGVDISNLKRWAARIAPWLIWSLKVAFVVAKVASQAVLPGLAQLINTFPSPEQQDANISSTVAYWFSAALMVGGEIGISEQATGIAKSNLNDSSPLRPVAVKEDLYEILHELIGDMKPTEFHTKLRLKKVVLNDSGHIVWICDACYDKYYEVGKVELL